MVVKCFIEFDNNKLGTYYAGQIITGRVTLEANKPKQVKSIVLNIRGAADTTWSETTGTGDSRNSTRHWGHEDYLNTKTLLRGCEGEGDQLITIEPGIYTYNFACQLPKHCPSSFEGFYGRIRYFIKLELIRPWKFNQTYTKCFTVLKVMDLNYDTPLLRVPVQAEDEKTLCCGPCKSPPLHLQVTLPQSGYVPGQAIAVGILISNETNKKIEALTVELVTLVNYYTQNPTKTKDERISVVKRQLIGGVPVNCKKLLNYPLIVPATPPTCFNLCSLIKIAYQVEVTAKVKGWHRSLVVAVPLTVGNVPLMSDHVVQKQPKAVETAENNGMTECSSSESCVVQTDLLAKKLETTDGAAVIAVTTTPPPSPWAEDENIPLPNYATAVHMKPAKINADVENDYGDREFVPHYAFFNISSPGINDSDSIDGATFSRNGASGSGDGESGAGNGSTADEAHKTSTWI